MTENLSDFLIFKPFSDVVNALSFKWIFKYFD